MFHYRFSMAWYWGCLALFAATSCVAEEPLCMELDSVAQEINLAASLLELEQVTHTVAASGRWSDVHTWADGRLPRDHARVLVPPGTTLTIDTAVRSAIDWLIVEGELAFSSEANAQLRACTILVKRGGKFRIGSPESPLPPQFHAEVVFLPRSNAKIPDRFEITGGLISLGTLEIHGARKTPFALPSATPDIKHSSITLAQPVEGWRVGDELLFPAACHDEHDERVLIKAISADQKTVTLAARLASSHRSPALIGQPIPVGNLSRNIVFRSEKTTALDDRGHIMIMSHVGNEIHGARFVGLGRTSAKLAHTLPDVRDDGTVDNGNNPIGRYAVHFHLRQAASVKLPPQHFAGNVIVDSPKHGLVNHGSHVIAADNVTYAIHGSHFFAENGTELGEFRNNLAVYSEGSGDSIRSRDSVYDFGHGGHGFWTQSALVAMNGNYAFHHKGAAYSIFARPVFEFGQAIFFRRENLPPHLYSADLPELITTGLPFVFTKNVGANANIGLELWNTNTYHDIGMPSVVEQCSFWDTRENAIFWPYTSNTTVRDTKMLHDSHDVVGAVGILGNQGTTGVTLQRVTLAGFQFGIWCPSVGKTKISESHFDNQFNIRLGTALSAGRVTVLEDNTFGGLLAKPIKHRVDYELLPLDYSFRGDISVVFEHDEIRLRDGQFANQTLYFPGQHPDAIPFNNPTVPQLNGKTAQKIWDSFGLAIGGRLAPSTARQHPQVLGWVGPIPSLEAIDPSSKTRHAGAATRDQNLNLVSFVREGEVTGWRLEKHASDQTDGVTLLTYVDKQPPEFKLDSRIKLEIHPDDVKHGFMICGVLCDKIGGVETYANIIQNKKNLTVDEDGYVTISHDFVDAVGNKTPQQFRLKVTDQAVRRGANLDYYAQENFGNASKDSTYRWKAFLAILVSSAFSVVVGVFVWRRGQTKA